MDGVLDAVGLTNGIKHCFASVFAEFNVATEVWARKNMLLTTGRDNYARYIAVTVGSIPLFATSRVVAVEDAYVLVGLSQEFERERYRSVGQIERALRMQRRGVNAREGKSQTSVSPEEALELSSGVFALLGAPGSGKTTALRHLVVSAASGSAIRGAVRIPIFLAARDMAAGQTGIETAAVGQFRSHEMPEPAKVLVALAKAGKLLLCLDGIDETSLAHQRILISELLQLQARYPNALFCVSARPHSLDVGLPNSSKWETFPLPFYRRLEFVRRWFAGVDAAKGERLVGECKQRPELLDIGSSPLLLSIICALFHNDLEIPRDVDELFSRTADGLLGQWDAFRNVARETSIGRLSLTKRFSLVAELAASMFENKKIVFSVADVENSGCLERISEVLRFQGLDARETLETLTNDYGVLLQRSPGLYSFSHLTLHEYFVARHAVAHRTELNLISEYRRDERWGEVVKFVARLLLNGDSFLRALHAAVDFSQDKPVRMLIAIWGSQPICSEAIRKQLMADLARRVVAVFKHCVDDFALLEDELVMQTRLLGRIRHARATIKARRLEEAAESDDGSEEHSPALEDPVEIEQSKEDKEPVKGGSNEQRLAKHSSILVAAVTLPGLLEILNKHKFDPSDIGVGRNAFFKQWFEAGFPEIRKISFRDAVPQDRGKALSRWKRNPRPDWDEVS
ncbi:MAG: NACHT domain-containing protein [Polaromonas sp.]|nr:NACHT domain-containing protein [Polaromonas sp.]